MSHYLPKFALSICVTALLLLTGCLEFKDKLKVNKDGSGSWQYDLTLGPKLTALLDQAEAKQNDGDPSIRLKPGKDYLADKAMLETEISKIKGAKLVKFSKKRTDGSINIRARIDFESLKNVLESNLGEKIRWSFREKKGKLYGYIVDPFQFKMSAGSDVNLKKNMAMVKMMLAGVKVERILELPDKIVKSNGKSMGANKVCWKFEIKDDITDKQIEDLSKQKLYVYSDTNGVTIKLPIKAKEKPAAGAISGNDTVNSKNLDTTDKLKLSPYQAVVTRQLSYSPTMQNLSNDSMNFAFALAWPKDMQPAGYKQIVIEKAVDNTGTDLRTKVYHSDTIHKLNKMQKKDSAYLSCFLKAPSHGAKTLSVKGYVIVPIPEGVEEVIVKDIQGQAGKELDDPKLSSFKMTVKAFTGKNVDIESPVNLSKILELQLVSPDGKTRQNAWYTNNMPWGHNFKVSSGFQKSIADASLAIRFAKTLKDYKVPFAFDDLKLP